VLLAALCLLLLPADLRAQDPQAKAEAKALLKRGNVLHGDKDYPGALKMFRRAYELFPSYKITFNIANTRYAMGDRPGAASSYEAFVDGATPRTPPAALELARQRLQELRRKLAAIRVSCSEEQADVRVDGQPAGKTPLERRLYLLPGPHQVLLVKPGFRQATLTLVLAPGEQRQLVVPLKPRTAPPPPQPAPVPGPPQRPPPPDHDPLAKQRSAKSIWAYTTLGVGLALMVGAGAMYGLGAAEGNQAHQDYREATAPARITRHREAVEAARVKLYVGHGLMGAAAVALGVSVYMFVTRPENRREEGQPALTVGPTPGGAAVQLRGTF
jgi:tetratricopeptide (TPR) repeat protein